MILKLKNITHSFGGNEVFKNLSFSFEGGKVYSLIGENGTGKTTLFNIINGYIIADKGSVILESVDITKVPTYKRFRLGIMRQWQNAEVFENLTIWNYLVIQSKHVFRSMLSSLFSNKNDERKKRADEILGEIGLKIKKDELCENLSFGQKKLLAFGRLLMDERIDKGKTIVLMDEPFAGIHHSKIDYIVDKIIELASKGNCIILIEHNLDRVEKISNIIVKLENQKLLN